MSWSKLLETRPFVLLDGGMGSELQRRGFDLQDPLWSAKVLLERPEAVLQVHLDYLSAGADVISTASYQISEPGFERRGLTKKSAREALIRSLRLAETAARRHVEAHGERPILIAASLGPYGAVLADGSEYRGQYDLTRAELVDFHRARFEVLEGSDAALVALETFPTRTEAEAALEALASFPHLRAWLSLVPREDETVFEPLQAPNLVALSFNCGSPMTTLGRAMDLAAATPLPVLAYPNRGGQWDPEKKHWALSAEIAVEDWVQEAMTNGLRGLGGCCEVGPGDIATMRVVIDQRLRASRP